MGRPKKENPRNRQIRIRLTEAEWAAMKAASEEIGTDISNLLRESFWDYLRHFDGEDQRIIVARANDILKEMKGAKGNE